MPASNIPSVVLEKDGSVTIEGEFTGIAKYEVGLLHVWLAGTRDDGQHGVGLAIDCLKKGQKGVRFKRPKFTLTHVFGANGAKFGPGPATVSAIAVLTPKPASTKKLVAEVIQWSRTLSLVTGQSR
ncbi:MAG: hypothetical protein ACLP4R_25240 [Solirubrobacteraceae bacterium]